MAKMGWSCCQVYSTFTADVYALWTYMSRMVIQQKQCRIFGTIPYFFMKVMNPFGKQSRRNVSQVITTVIVLGGSPAKNPPLILLCPDTTMGRMWSPLTLTAEVGVMF
jgi:hypothetical protein